MERSSFVPLFGKKPLILLVAGVLGGFFASSSAHARVELQPCKNSISTDQQIELGKKAVEQVYQQMPVLPDSSPVSRYVQALGQKLVAQAPGYRWPYNFHVVNVADINAFALPGGSIFVNLGTVQAASDEAQLAAVMAHEISHVALQHSVCNLEKQRRVGILAGIGQIASGVLLGDSNLGILAQKGIGITAGLSFLRMSRDAEQQADLEGVGILYDAGYDPRAMPQFFETIQAKYGEGGAQFLSDHPNPGNRTEYVDREISSFPPKTNYATNSRDFVQIHKVATGMRPYTSKEVDSGVWKRKDPNQPSGPGASAPAPGNVDLSPPQQWSTFQGNGFRMQLPSNWQVMGHKNSAMMGPPGGIAAGASGGGNSLYYGLLTDVYRPEQGGTLDDGFSALVTELSRENPGLAPGSVTRVTVGNVSARSMHSVNRAANNGRGEHDWIVGVPQANAIRYLVFVSPVPDFNTMRPTFERVLNSLVLQ